MPLEDNFRKNITARQASFWCQELRGWSDSELLRTVQFIKADCKFFPTMADFDRLRPAPHEVDYTEGEGKAWKHQPVTKGSFAELVRDMTVKGLKWKNMVWAYDQILADPRCVGQERQQFEEARRKTAELCAGWKNGSWSRERYLAAKDKGAA